MAEQVKTFFARRGFLLTRYVGGSRDEWLGSILRVKSNRILLLDPGEACQLLSAIRATEHIPGEMAELGVAFGASARLMGEYAGNRTLHLFDTFEGLPTPGAGDSAKFGAGDFRGPLDSVKQYLEGMRVEFHKGLFPRTADAVRDKKFSFVHLDVDLYDSTLEGLKFFYPRMSPGAILISHDYLSATGVTRAFAEFFQDKPEPVIELSGYQAMFVKLGPGEPG